MKAIKSDGQGLKVIKANASLNTVLSLSQFFEAMYQLKWL